MIVLFTESNIGIHNPDNEEYEVLKYVFIPSITRRKDKFIPEITPKSPRIAELLGEYKKKTSDFSFLMGYDLDENGELMAQALKNHLVDNDVKDSDILRTPLTSEGYMAISDFLDISDYCKFLYYQKKLINILKKEKLNPIPMGILDILAIKYLDTKRGKSIDLDSLKETLNIEGTSTITFIVNNLIKGDNEDEVFDK